MKREMTAGMPETIFITDHQREYLLSWKAITGRQHRACWRFDNGHVIPVAICKQIT